MYAFGVLFFLMLLYQLYTVVQKLHPFYFLNYFVKSRSILIIFRTQVYLN